MAAGPEPELLEPEEPELDEPEEDDPEELEPPDPDVLPLEELPDVLEPDDPAAGPPAPEEPDPDGTAPAPEDPCDPVSETATTPGCLAPMLARNPLRARITTRTVTRSVEGLGSLDLLPCLNLTSSSCHGFLRCL